MLELRKLFATRSTRTLLVGLFGTGVAFSILATGVSYRESHAIDWATAYVPVLFGIVIAAPILGVLVMSSDWQSRTIVTYYLHEPRRLRVFVAKVVAAVATAVTLVLASAVATLLISLSAAVVLGVRWTDSGIRQEGLTESLGYATVGALTGAAIGAALLNTSLALVLVLISETILPLALAAVPSALPDYVSPANTFNTSGGLLVGLSATALWVAVPIAVGAVRNQRKDAL